MEDNTTDVPKHTVCDASDARSYLEEENIINSDKEFDVSALVEALIHISALGSIPLPAYRAIHSVTLILDQLKLAGTREAITSLIKKKVDVLVESATKKATASLKAAADTAVEELGATSLALVDTGDSHTYNSHCSR